MQDAKDILENSDFSLGTRCLPSNPSVRRINLPRRFEEHLFYLDMKRSIKQLAIAFAVFPILVHAQPHENSTREQVQAEMIEIQRAGYDGAHDNTTYPSDIQAASAKAVARPTSPERTIKACVNNSPLNRADGVSQAEWNAMYAH